MVHPDVPTHESTHCERQSDACKTPSPCLGPLALPSQPEQVHCHPVTAFQDRDWLVQPDGHWPLEQQPVIPGLDPPEHTLVRSAVELRLQPEHKQLAPESELHTSALLAHPAGQWPSEQHPLLPTSKLSLQMPSNKTLETRNGLPFTSAVPLNVRAQAAIAVTDITPHAIVVIFGKLSNVLV